LFCPRDESQCSRTFRHICLNDAARDPRHLAGLDPLLRGPLPHRCIRGRPRRRFPRAVSLRLRDRSTHGRRRARPAGGAARARAAGPAR
jgi:hypothetical protein